MAKHIAQLLGTHIAFAENMSLIPKAHISSSKRAVTATARHPGFLDKCTQRDPTHTNSKTIKSKLIFIHAKLCMEFNNLKLLIYKVTNRIYFKYIKIFMSQKIYLYKTHTNSY